MSLLKALESSLLVSGLVFDDNMKEMFSFPLQKIQAFLASKATIAGESLGDTAYMTTARHKLDVSSSNVISRLK